MRKCHQDNSHSFCKLNSEVTSHHFGCILFVRGESLDAAHTQREVITQDVTARRRGSLGSILFCAQCLPQQEMVTNGRFLEENESPANIKQNGQDNSNRNNNIPLSSHLTGRTQALGSCLSQYPSFTTCCVTLHIYLICLAFISLSEDNNSTHHICSIDIFKKSLLFKVQKNDIYYQ